LSVHRRGARRQGWQAGTKRRPQPALPASCNSKPPLPICHLSGCRSSGVGIAGYTNPGGRAKPCGHDGLCAWLLIAGGKPVAELTCGQACLFPPLGLGVGRVSTSLARPLAATPNLLPPKPPSGRRRLARCSQPPAYGRRLAFAAALKHSRTVLEELLAPGAKNPRSPASTPHTKKPYKQETSAKSAAAQGTRPENSSMVCFRRRPRPFRLRSQVVSKSANPHGVAAHGWGSSALACANGAGHCVLRAYLNPLSCALFQAALERRLDLPACFPSTVPQILQGE